MLDLDVFTEKRSLHSFEPLLGFMKGRRLLSSKVAGHGRRQNPQELGRSAFTVLSVYLIVRSSPVLIGALPSYIQAGPWLSRAMVSHLWSGTRLVGLHAQHLIVPGILIAGLPVSVFL